MRTLSRSPAPPGSPIEAAPLQFADRRGLVAALRGADTLYNTYWIRFERGASTFERAVENTRVLLRAAEEAGLRRIVHVSVTNAAEDSPLPYFRGKGAVERAVRESPLSHAIVRPTLVFGPHDILVNNVAWILRRFPLFVVPGMGTYRVQPVGVEDVAELAVAAADRPDDVAFDAAGPEIYPFDELVRLVAQAVASRARIVHAPAALALLLVRLGGVALRDVVLTREELEGLTSGLLVSDEPPRGRRSFRGWLEDAGSGLGRVYVSELARNFRPYAPV